MKKFARLFVVPMLFGLVHLEAHHLSAEDHSNRLNQLLSSAKLDVAAKEFSGIVQGAQDDHQARTALGLIQFMQAIEQLAQQNHKYGLLNEAMTGIPGTQLPVPVNPDPAEISYDDYRRMIKTFRDQLAQAEATLAGVEMTGDLKLKFHIGNAMMDLNQDGQVTKGESLGAIFSTINLGRQQLAAGDNVEPLNGERFDNDAIENFYVGVDGADVHWLRGYCHFLMAMDDAVLAYDQQQLFERCAHLLYPKVQSPYSFLRDEETYRAWDARRIADVIAFVHLMNFELVDAEQMRSAHAHLLEMMQQSRKCWERALKETDNDQEWIPNPDQVSVIRMRVNQQQVNAWGEVVDEVEAILQGKKLIPFWRMYARTVFDRADVPDEGQGINLKKFFQEPQNFDLVLLLTGTDATPYLEQGALSTPETWQRLQRVFQGQFFGFALWFN